MFQYCPRCKEPIQHNPSKIECSACDFLFFIAPAPATSFVTIDSETSQLIVTVRKREPRKGMLGLIGGFMEHDETIEEGACREFAEETGYEIKPEEITYLTSATNKYHFEDYEYDVIDSFFTVTVPFSKLTPLDDVDELLLIKRNELDLDKFAFMAGRLALEEFLKQ